MFASIVVNALRLSLKVLTFCLAASIAASTALFCTEVVFTISSVASFIALRYVGGRFALNPFFAAVSCWNSIADSTAFLYAVVNSCWRFDTAWMY
jgi:hypothetical protein